MPKVKRGWKLLRWSGKEQRAAAQATASGNTEQMEQMTAELEQLRQHVEILSMGFNARIRGVEDAVRKMTEGLDAKKPSSADGDVHKELEEMRKRMDSMQNCFVALSAALPKAPDPLEVLAQVEADLRNVVTKRGRPQAQLARLPVEPTVVDWDPTSPTSSYSPSAANSISPSSGAGSASPTDGPAAVNALAGGSQLSWDWPMTNSEQRSRRLQVEATVASHRHSAMKKEIQLWRHSSPGEMQAITDGIPEVDEAAAEKEEEDCTALALKDDDVEYSTPTASSSQTLAMDWPLSKTEKRQRAETLHRQILSHDRMSLENKLKEARKSLSPVKSLSPCSPVQTPRLADDSPAAASPEKTPRSIGGSPSANFGGA